MTVAAAWGVIVLGFLLLLALMWLEGRDAGRAEHRAARPPDVYPRVPDADTLDG